MEAAAIFDTETTDAKDPVMIQAAIILAYSPEELLAGSGIASDQYFNPGVPISYSAMAVHGITEEDVDDCPPPSEFSLSEEIKYLIGHNIDFDWRVIGEPDIKRICTLAMARYLMPEFDDHKQLTLLFFFDKKLAKFFFSSAHNAATDVQITNAVLCNLIGVAIELGELPECPSFEQIWEFSEKARIPKVMAFGKHKGMPIAEVPRDYKQWLLGQPDVDPYLRKALTGSF